MEASLSGLLVLAGVGGRSAVLATLVYRLAEMVPPWSWGSSLIGSTAGDTDRFGSANLRPLRRPRDAQVRATRPRRSSIPDHTAGLEPRIPFRRHRPLVGRVLTAQGLRRSADGPVHHSTAFPAAPTLVSPGVLWILGVEVELLYDPDYRPNAPDSPERDLSLPRPTPSPDRRTARRAFSLVAH